VVKKNNQGIASIYRGYKSILIHKRL